MTTTPPPPAFVDLRLFAESTRPAGGHAGAPARRLLPLPPGPASVGALWLPPGTHRDAIDADLFVLALDAPVSLHCPQGATALEPGTAAVVRAGTDLQWHAPAGACVVFMRHDGGGSGDGGVVPIDRDPPLAPSRPPLPELLTTPTPRCRSYSDYRSADATFDCGTWDSTPYSRRATRYRHHELMHLLDGEVSFRSTQGETGTFRGGDTVLLLREAECSWDSPVDVRKIYAIWRPA